MKKWTTLLARIKGFKRNNKGSVTLEAALIFPLIIIIFYLLYLFLLACMIQMSMKSVGVTMVNSIASQIHAVDKVGQLVKQTSGYSGDDNNRGDMLDEEWKMLSDHIIAVMPEPIYSVIEQGQRGNWWPAENLATTILGKQLFENILLELPESRGFEKDRLSLVYLQLPDIVNYTDANVKITLQYELPYSIPFIGQSLIIREQASQRAWLPDARSSNFTVTEDDMFIQLVSISPNPVRPGNRAQITVKTKPQAQLNIKIIYKSGTSVAKNLEVMQANEHGVITWEWFVSGNTTPGYWEYDITEVNGDAALQGVFEVRKKEKG